MSDELETTLEPDYSLRLPKLNDKTIYFARVDDDGVVTQKSYAVSSSFKGILRTSPNDYDLLSDNSCVYEGITYSDSNDIFLYGGPIQVSDSDGYLIDLKLSPVGIEIDNTYVRGMMQTDNLVLFANRNENAFIVGGINYLPVAHDTSFTTTTGAWITDNDYVKIVTTTPILSSEDIEDDAEYEEDTILDSDKSAIVVSKSVGDTRSFDHDNTRTLIKEVILDALQSLKTVPPGSIHFVPVNIDEYQALMKSDTDATGSLKDSPGYNRYTTLGNEITNSLIRDYLPCDGRQYYCRDFPELAKILKDEYVAYEIEGKYNTDEDGLGGTSAIIQEEMFNDNSETTIKTFRVPDLRHKFIKSAWLKKSSAFSYSDYKCGLYTPDHMPDKFDAETDKHSHFMASAISSRDILPSVGTSSYCYPTDVCTVSEDGSLSLTTPTIMKLATMVITASNCCNNTVWLGTQPSGQGSQRWWCYPVRMANFFWSQQTYTISDDGYDYDQNNEDGTAKWKATTGLTSYDIPSFSTNDIFAEDSDGVYNLEVTNTRSHYGYESCPEFVACLPLIKI